MQYTQYRHQLIRITDTQGRTFTGVAEAFTAEAGLREFGRGEAGLRVGGQRLFEGDIAKVECLPTLEEAQREIPPGRYRHFKGNEYEVLCVARHSETTEPMVVYRALYGEGGVWVRPAAMWNETVERGGNTYRRFTRIDEGDPQP